MVVNVWIDSQKVAIENCDTQFYLVGCFLSLKIVGSAEVDRYRRLEGWMVAYLIDGLVALGDQVKHCMKIN